jgi:hypothetical protein
MPMQLRTRRAAAKFSSVHGWGKPALSISNTSGKSLRIIQRMCAVTAVRLFLGMATSTDSPGHQQQASALA